jgi:ubiquinone/menaquinone biosynthesis C-methylase UbiE
VAVDAIAEGTPARVLDVGAGTGDFSERVRRELDVDLIGLDLSPRMAELTRGRGLGNSDIPSPTRHAARGRGRT